jgi:hypothetical protein
MLSFLIVDGRIIKPQLEGKFSLQQSILSGSEETQKQYSILSPAVSFSMQKLADAVMDNNYKIRLYSFEILAFFSFLILFLLTYLYLRVHLDDNQTMIGLVLVQLLLALILQNEYSESSIFNLIFFAMGLLLISIRRDAILPLIIFLGAFNQAQILSLLLFYIIWLFSEGKLLKLRSAFIFLLSLGLWMFAMSLLKSFYGLRTEQLSAEMQIANIPALIMLLLVILIAAIKSISKTERIFKLSLLFIPLYLIFTLMMMPQATFLDLSPVLLFLIPGIVASISDNNLTEEMTE